MSVMDRTTFLKNYRIRLMYDGSTLEPDRNGPAISYEAADQRTAEPVSVTLIPTESIDPTERQQFEDNVSVAQKLRHANIAKVLDFGREGDDYVYVSERLAGETLASWVRSHGPMPADAALRVGEQIVSVLSSAGFHKLPYPSIQPSDIVLVPGQTAEGTWPLVKLTNFGLPALRPLAEASVAEPEAAAYSGSAEQIVKGPFGQPTTDIRSEIYSLGVTLYFLLSGVALSAEALQHGPKFSGFPKPSIWDTVEDKYPASNGSSATSSRAKCAGGWRAVAASGGNCADGVARVGWKNHSRYPKTKASWRSGRRTRISGAIGSSSTSERSDYDRSRRCGIATGQPKYRASS